MTHVSLPTTTLRRLIAALAVIVASCSTMLTAQAAQDTGIVDDTTYVMEEGQTVTWSPPWAFDEDFTIKGDGTEILLFEDAAASLMISSLPNLVDIEEARDIVLDSLTESSDSQTTIDKGAYGAISYSLDLVDLAGADYGAFTLFRAGTGSSPTFAYIFLGSVNQFAEKFSSAQTSFALDGAGLFDGVDGQGLQDQLEANAGNANEGNDTTPEAPEPDDDVTPEDDGETPEPDDGDKLRNGRDTPDPTEEAGDEINTDAPDGTGLIEDGLFVSPLFLAELTWDDTYTVDTELDVYVSSDGVNNVDFLALKSSGDGPALLSVQFVLADGATPAQLVEVWQSADFLGDTEFSQGSEVVLADSSSVVGGVVIRDALEDGTAIVTYREVHLLEDLDALAVFTFTSVPAYAETAISDSQNGVELNGEPVLDFFTVEDILADF
jgi:hypothetical protein